MLLNVFVETVEYIFVFMEYFVEHLFETVTFCNIIKCLYYVTFEQFNVSLLNKSKKKKNFLVKIFTLHSFSCFGWDELTDETSFA